jgi:hypothetical protein
VPALLTVPNVRPVELFRLMLPLVLLRLTVPVSVLPALFKVIAPALPVKLAIPALAACVMTVLATCEIPKPFKFKLPLPTVTFPNDRANEFVRLTLLALLLDKVTAPVNALPVLVRVIALEPAEKLEVPDTVNTSDCVSAPVLLMVKLPTASLIARLNAPVLTRAISPLPVLTAVKLLKVLAPFKVWPPAELVVNAPLTAPAPVSEIAPVDVNDTALPVTVFVRLNAPVLVVVTVPALLTVPKVRLVELFRLILLLLPVLARLTVPVKLLPELFKVIAPAFPFKVAAPALAAWVIAVLVICEIPKPFKFNVPLPTVTFPNDNANEFVKLTLLTSLLDKVTAPVNALPALVKVMALEPAEKLEVPDTVNTPDCVNAPVLLMVKLPTASLIARLNAPVLTKAISPLPVLTAVKLLNVLAPFKVWPPAELVVNTPLTSPAPVSEIAPVEVKETALPVTVFVRLNVPVLVVVTVPALLTVPSVKSVELFRPMLPLVLLRLTVPVSALLALFKVIAPALPVKVAAPALAACKIAVLATCVMPMPLMFNTPEPTFTLPNDNEPLLKRLTSFAPLFDRATLPVKLLPELFKVITPALPLKLAAPALAAWVTAVPAACVMPNPFTFNAPLPTVTFPNDKAIEFIKLTSLAPLLDKVTLPVNALPLFVRVIALAPAVKLELPDTVNTPDWVNAPVLLMVKLPTASLIARLNAPVLISAISPLPVLIAVKLLKVLAPFKVWPPTELVVNAPLIAPAPLSVIAPVEVKDTALPVIVFVRLNAPVFVVVTVPALLTVPNVRPVELFRLMLPLVLLRLTVPVSVLPALFKVIAPALPVKLAAPALAA